MQKLSQKELLEGFGSNLMKSVGRGIAGAAKTAAKMISPTAVDVAKKAGDKVGGAIANIAFGSPKAALQEYFNRPEVKSKYKDFQVDSSKDINKMRKKLVISVTDVKTNKKVTGEVEAYRTDSGGMAAETWGFDKFKLSNGEVIDSRGTQPSSETVSDTSTETVKFYDALKDWKLKNIGPEAASVGISGQQTKEFLTSIGVKDADRVIAQSGLDNYGKIISNKQLATIEATLKQRGTTA